MISTVQFLGQTAIRASNGPLEMTIVPGWGGQLLSLRSVSQGLELLRVPVSSEAYLQKPVLYGIPILFPPNRIERGAFEFAGRSYQLELNDASRQHHIHGLVYSRPWVVHTTYENEQETVVVTEFDASKHEEVLAQFPHPFRLRMSYALRGEQLTMAAEVTNLSDSEMPWGLGYHTTVNFPFRSGDPLAGCSIRSTVDRRWVLNSLFVPTGELEEYPAKDELQRGMSLEGVKLDDVLQSTAAQPGDPNEAVLTDHSTGLELTYRCDPEFLVWVLHNGGGDKGYLCPEPYTWVTNAPNVPRDRKLTGLQSLQPGESKTVSTDLALRWL